MGGGGAFLADLQAWRVTSEDTDLSKRHDADFELMTLTAVGGAWKPDLGFTKHQMWTRRMSLAAVGSSLMYWETGSR